MRLFKTSNLRNYISLDGLWDFCIDPCNKGESEEWFKNFPQDAEQMYVPLCWNTESKYFKYEGKAWYRTYFDSRCDTYNLYFDSVQKACKVYVDGKELAYHYGGFTGFTVTGKGVGRHCLVVMADNTHNDINTIPLAHVDWFHYGGISGSVSLVCYKDAYIDKHRISYILEGKSAKVNVKFNICGNYSSKVKVTFDEKTVAEFDGKSGENVCEFSVENIELWDTENPVLYNVGIVIDNDDIIDRIGFRTIEARNKKIYLNNREIKLKGINRHNDCPDFGFSMPFVLMKRDIEIIRDLGCNVIRGSHYPNPEILLDYFDSTGMLFWEEIPMWGFKKDSLADPVTLERGLMMHSEMIERDYHHPSIILWGLHNEIETTCIEGYNLSKKFADHIRSLDDSRLVTFATARPAGDLCLALADVISVNMYPGWYGGHNCKDECDEIMKQLYANMEKLDVMDKPLMITEFGAGAVMGQSTFTYAKWTEQYQASLIADLVDKYYNDYDVNGTFVWQYCDMYSAFEKELERPRSFNNKGIVDEYRRPKLGYYALKNAYEKIKD